jgi:hypothetical protein
MIKSGSVVKRWKSVLRERGKESGETKSVLLPEARESLPGNERLANCNSARLRLKENQG